MTLEEQAIKVLDESASDSESNLVDELVQEFPVLAGSLVKTINRRNKTNLEIPKKERITKNRILLDITSSLSKINGELIIVNSRLQAQNDLLRGNLAFTSNTIGNLEYNDSLLTNKLDSVLEALKTQNEFMRDKEEDKERDDIEKGGERTKDAAWTESFTQGHLKGSPLMHLIGSIVQDKFRNFFIRKIYRLFTKKGFRNVLARTKNLFGFKTAAKGFDHIALNPKQSKFMKPKWWQAIGDHISPLTKPLTKKIDAIGNSPWGKGLVQALTNPGKWLQQTRLGKTATSILGNLDHRIIGSRLRKKMPLVMAKFVGRNAPLAGAGISYAEIPGRLKEGDKFGAWLAGIGGSADTASYFTSPAVATGAGAVIPGALQAVSMGADITLLLWDIFRAVTTPAKDEMEHGGVIQAPPILTPAEKGAVIGGGGSSDIGSMVDASAMILDRFGLNLSGISKLRNDFPVDGSTGIITLNPLAAAQPVREDDVEPKENDSQTKENESNIDTSDTSDTLESNDTNTTSVAAIDSQTGSDTTTGLGVKDGDNIAFNWRKPSDNIEQLRYKSDHPLGTEQPNPFKEGSTLYKNFERLRLYDKSGMTISSSSNVNNISNITPVTETNNISDNISFDVDPVGKTKIIYVTKTISTPGRVVNGGGNIIIQNVKKKDKHKLSRLILA